MSYLKKPINIFTLVILVGFAGALVWLGHQRYIDYVISHQISADSATAVSSAEIEQFINDRRRFVNTFVKDNYRDIYELSQNPEDEELHSKIKNKMSEYYPDHFTSNIASDSGDPIIDDFNGELGELCVADMKSFASGEQDIVRVHPSHGLYHFDIVVKFSANNEEKLFFSSFGLNEIAKLLKLAQPKQHELMLVIKNPDHLIEITESGGRDKIADRLDFRFTQDEKRMIHSYSHVDGTLWDVVDVYKKGLLKSYWGSLWIEGAIIYLAFILVVFFMRRYLANEEYKRTIAEGNLVLRNREIKELNDRLLSTNKELERTSITDGLTGVNNRRYFDKRIKEEWQRAMRKGYRVSLAIIDVDYFKQYNDLYGHQKGDQCLKTIASIMSHHLMRADDFMARYGGEEFVLVLIGNDRQDSIKFVTNLISAVEEEKIEHSSSDISSYVTISAGVASIIPTEKDLLEEFIEEADRALYRAKKGGRNRVEAL